MGFSFKLEFCSGKPNPRGVRYSDSGHEHEEDDPILLGTFTGGRYNNNKSPIWCFEWEIEQPHKIRWFKDSISFKPRPNGFGYQFGDLQKAIKKFGIESEVERCLGKNQARISISRDYTRLTEDDYFPEHCKCDYYSPCKHSAGDIDDLMTLIKEVKQISGATPGLIENVHHEDFVDGCNDSSLSDTQRRKLISSKFKWNHGMGNPPMPLRYLVSYLKQVCKTPNLIDDLVERVVINGNHGFSINDGHVTIPNILNPIAEVKTTTEIKNVFDSNFENVDLKAASDSRKIFQTYIIYDDIRKICIQKNNKKIKLEAVEATIRQGLEMPAGANDCTVSMELLKNASPIEISKTVKNETASNQKSDVEKRDDFVESKPQEPFLTVPSTSDKLDKGKRERVSAQFKGKKALDFMANWHPVLKIIAWIYFFPFLIAWLIIYQRK